MYRTTHLLPIECKTDTLHGALGWATQRLCSDGELLVVGLLQPTTASRYNTAVTISSEPVPMPHLGDERTSFVRVTSPTGELAEAAFFESTAEQPVARMPVEDEPMEVTEPERLLRVRPPPEVPVPVELLGSAEETLRNQYPADRIVGGRYILEQSVGEGGMGRIYKVRHRDLGKRFALKIIHQSLAQQPHIRDAFYREAQMAASMTHPNIVSVFDYGWDQTHGAFIVMEYLSGETLADRLSRDGSIEWKGACDIIIQCAEALSFIHSTGVIHCDIKPDDVAVCAYRR